MDTGIGVGSCVFGGGHCRSSLSGQDSFLWTEGVCFQRSSGHLVHFAGGHVVNMGRQGWLASIGIVAVACMGSQAFRGTVALRATPGTGVGLL